MTTQNWFPQVCKIHRHHTWEGIRSSEPLSRAMSHLMLVFDKKMYRRFWSSNLNLNSHLVSASEFSRNIFQKSFQKETGDTKRWKIHTFFKSLPLKSYLPSVVIFAAFHMSTWFLIYGHFGLCATSRYVTNVFTWQNFLLLMNGTTPVLLQQRH